MKGMHEEKVVESFHSFKKKQAALALTGRIALKLTSGHRR